jgi:Melibiase
LQTWWCLPAWRMQDMSISI